jgi:outer membrane protein assembly factor BamB
MLYYTEPISTTEPSSGPTVCVDLQTGQQIWSSTAVPALSFGYIYDAQDPNEHGVWPPMLVATEGSTWQVYDADTGDPLFNVTNVPSGVTLLGPEGEYLVVSLVNLGPTTMTPYGPVSSGPASWYLQEWNSSRLWDDLYSGPSTTPTLPPPITNGANPSLLDFNVSVPVLNGLPSVTAVGAILGNELLCYSGNLPSTGADLFFGSLSDTPYTYYGINLNATVDTVGAKLWSNTLQPPAGNITVTEAGIDPVNNVFVEEYRETMQFVGYSLSTGDKLWGPTAGQQALDYYGSPGSGSLADAIDYGKIYSSAYGGILYCYDTKTGDLLWTYGNGGAGNSTNSGVETPFGYYPTFVNAIGSGVVYLVTTEHTIETPLFKGALARAVNATTGAQIWTLSDYTGEFVTDSFAIADGYATFFNGYDNQIYAVGQGPSATTVQAPLTAITEGSNVVIQGTVMDVSAGTQQTEQKGDFPNGVPVASDASMTAWMGYVYQQQPLPTNFTGVTVQIAAIDPNGNHVVVGTATTDANGMFHYTWTTPNVPGTYTVYATFAGTNGYYGSNAETNMVVQSAPTATAAPTPTPTSLADQYFLPVSIAIIIVIVIVGAVLALLMLRKHP